MDDKTEDKIYEIKLQGRGGQGIVTAGELLGKAASLEGKYAQSIPTFGPERRGALSSCSLRIGMQEILLKCSITKAEIICLFDPTIWHFFTITEGFQEKGVLAFNTTKSPEEINNELTDGKYGYKLENKNYSIFTVDATGIALDIMGQAITNSAMMGTFSKVTGLVGIDSIISVLHEKFGAKADANIRIAQKAYENVTGCNFNRYKK
jgi:pyruvate ferredoxin oxidoreductase gamma subunit